MLNWSLLQPRNFVVVGVIAAVAFFIYNHFQKAST